MPLVTKLLFFAVGWGLSVFVILSFMRGAASKPTPMRPVSERRMRRLWIIDRRDER